jgi:nucleotide-binding universal stress UspA family protein
MLAGVLMNETEAGIKRILVAVDGSEQSNKAVRLASRIAKNEGAEMTLLHVIDVKDAPVLMAEAEDKGQEERSQTVLLMSAELALSENVQTKSVLRRGHVAGQVLRYAMEYQPQMIFIGTRGLGRGAALLMGSVSKSVVQGAKTSVVVVR